MLLLQKNGKFKLAKQKNIEKATKAMYEVIRRGKRHNLSIECLLDLFDKIVKPILLSISFSLYRKCTFSAVRLVEKTIIFVLSMFTLSFHNLLYSYKLFSKVCNPSEVSDIRTVSSAYKRAKFLKYISNCASSSLEILSKPVIFLSSINCSRSFKNTANKKGDKFSHGLTPISLEKKSDLFSL
jgi:hypothetical protein